MACEDKTLLLHAYLDGELDAMRSVELEEHLKSCAGCAEQLRFEKAMRQGIQSASLYARAPKGLEQRVIHAISGRDAAELMEITAGFESLRRRSVLQWLGAAAAVLIVAALAVESLPSILGRRQNELLAQEAVASHIRSLQPGHLFDVESTDQHTVKPWFDGKIDFAPPVRDFADQGFPLVGGRLDYVGNRTVAALVYQRRKHVISVFVWPAGSGNGNFEKRATVNGYNLTGWRSGAMDFCAVSDVSADDLQNLVQLFKQ